MFLQYIIECFGEKKFIRSQTLLIVNLDLYIYHIFYHTYGLLEKANRESKID